MNEGGFRICSEPEKNTKHINAIEALNKIIALHRIDSAIMTDLNANTICEEWLSDAVILSYEIFDKYIQILSDYLEEKE